MKNYIVGAVAVVALLTGIASYTKTPTTVVGNDGAKGAQGIQGERGLVGPQGPAGKDGKNGSGTYGSVTGPDSYLPYTANNDVQTYSLRKQFTTGTTTVCAIKSPAATSTLMFASAQFTISSTSASVVTLAIAATPWATTTILNNQAVSANAQATVMGSSTPVLASGAINSLVVAPNQYFVVGMADGTAEATAGTFSPVGSCEAVFVRN